MPTKSGREEAWEENFLEDIKTLSKEVLVELDKNLQLPLGYKDHYSFDFNQAGIALHNAKENKFLEVWLTAVHDEKEKVRWKIKIWIKNFLGSENISDDKRTCGFMINVSHREEYTQQELERAKKQILTKIYEFLKL